MKNLTYIFAFCLFLTGITSCSECTDEVESLTIVPFDPPTPVEFNQIQQDAFDGMIQTIQLDVTNGFTFTSSSGVNIFINVQCLSLNGIPVTGTVDFEYLEIYERGEMASSNITTVGINAAGEKELLISAGAFYINLSQNGQQIDLVCDGSIAVPTAITGGDDQQMGPFMGVVNNSGDIDWTLGNQEFSIDFGPSGPAYFTFFTNFGWFNCDKFINDPRPKTALAISVPQEFNQENTAVYLALVGEPNALGYIYGDFPIGLDVHIIFLSEENGDFRYASKTITIEENHIIAFARQETEVISEAELINRINALQ